MPSLEEMVKKVSVLYSEEGFSYIDARELVIQGSGVNKKHWPMLRTRLSSIHGQRGGKKKKPRKKTRIFSDWQIDMMIAESLDLMELRNDFLLDP